MTRLASVLCAFALVSAPVALHAQDSESGQTNLVLSVFGGINAGHSLWNIARQPLCVLQGSGGNYNGCQQYKTATDSGNLSDTLSFSRDVSSSILLGAAVSIFPNSHVGFHGEIYYFGLTYDDRCANVGAPYQSDPENKNQQLCNDFAATTASASARVVTMTRSSARPIARPNTTGVVAGSVSRRRANALPSCEGRARDTGL